MTPQEIITTARYILNDTNATGAGYRQLDPELLDYVNSGLKEMAVLNPAMFSTIGDYTCISGQCEQVLTFADAAALMEVLAIHQGTALTSFDMMSMNQFNPGWRADAAAPATQWTRFANDPLKFFIYPQAPGGQVLDVRYVRNPSTYALGDTIIGVPSVFQPALVDYVVYRAESKDSEHVLSQRAVTFQAAFAAQVKG